MNKNFHITSTAHRHIFTVAQESKIPAILRIKVDSGGCSGFKYVFEFVETIEPDDHVVEEGDVKVVVDSLSWTFLNEGQLDYIEEMMGSYFLIKNPNAQSSCGCGSSFSI